MKSLVRLLPFVRPYRVPALAAMTLLFFMVGADLLIPRLTQRIIDQGIGAGDTGVVLTTAAIMLGASVLSATFAIINNYLSVRVSMSVAADLRSALFRKVQTLSFGNLDRLQTGKLIVRSTSDVNQVQMIVMMSLRILTRAPFWMLGAVILLVLTSQRLALMMAAFVPVILLLVWRFAGKIQSMFLVVQERLDRLNTVLQENLAGVRVVKAFVRESHEATRFDEANEALTTGTMKVSEHLAIFIPAMLLILNLAVVGAVWIGGYSAISGEMTVGEVVAAINYLSFALFPVLMLSGMLGPIAAADASASRVLEVMDSDPEVCERPGAKPLVSPRGRIVFEEVGFGYSGERAELVLSGISFTAEPGETLAILGATGSGKSTLIHLIPRFYDVSAGRITFDGVDIRDLELRSLRSRVGVVLQESVLYAGTIRDNIRFGRMEADHHEVVTAARTAQAHEFIEQLEEGYDTVIGQRGVDLSGGQRQRVAIARALLVKPRVLILDDSTSAVDVETEVRLQDALEELLAQSRNSTTRIFVAQRISTVLLADRILILEGGRIQAMGTHRELLDSSPVYRDIFQSQLGSPGREAENPRG